MTTNLRKNGKFLKWLLVSVQRSQQIYKGAFLVQPLKKDFLFLDSFDFSVIFVSHSQATYQLFRSTQCTEVKLHFQHSKMMSLCRRDLIPEMEKRHLFHLSVWQNHTICYFLHCLVYLRYLSVLRYFLYWFCDFIG